MQRLHSGPLAARLLLVGDGGTPRLVGGALALELAALELLDAAEEGLRWVHPAELTLTDAAVHRAEEEHLSRVGLVLWGKGENTENFAARTWVQLHWQ